MKINKPTFLVDKSTCLSNIKRMKCKADDNHVQLRPHFKTHQNREIGHWYRQCGIHAITVSSIEMARFFADDGWDDITVSTTINRNQFPEINALASRINLNIVVEDESTIAFLSEKLTSAVGIFVKIDCGCQRTGIQIKQIGKIEKVLHAHCMIPKGFLCHAGHSYQATSKKEILVIHEETMDSMVALKRHFVNQFPSLQVSIGDTPTCSIAEKFSGIDEMRPGVFLFNDLQQLEIGSCSKEEIAVVVAVPVLAIHKDRKEVVVQGGAVYLSKDLVSSESLGSHYGEIVTLTDNGWTLESTGSVVSRVSQEHGIVRASDSFLEQVSVGDMIGVLPAHSCLSANLMMQSSLHIIPIHEKEMSVKNV